ncbi:MAG: tRNA (adenosine(37)-N6)-threonylcarbamoyltransferase complex dimerization subunit type 1 TsaB, partial [Bacilli bacterium]
MKYTILLDSSNTSLTVGLANDDSLLDSISYEAWQTQSEHMIPELDKLMKKHQVNKDDITSVVTAIGPGSYTGVRIALTIAKTIATALKIDLYPVSSLQILKNG